MDRNTWDDDRPSTPAPTLPATDSPSAPTSTGTLADGATPRRRRRPRSSGPMGYLALARPKLPATADGPDGEATSIAHHHDQAEIAPLDPDTGLPMYATGEVTKAPKWRQLERAPRRRAVRLLAWVAVIGAVASFAWLSWTYQPWDDEPDPPPADVDTGDAGG